jgi:hypothetical protein
MDQLAETKELTNESVSPPACAERLRYSHNSGECVRFAAWTPDGPTTPPERALRGVIYEDMRIRAGRIEFAIARGRAFPRIYGAGASPSCAAALCLEARP